VVSISEEEDSFENVSNNISVTLEINNKNIFIREDNYKIRYTIR
jgi:hypothetical protein